MDLDIYLLFILIISVFRALWQCGSKKVEVEKVIFCAGYNQWPNFFRGWRWWCHSISNLQKSGLFLIQKCACNKSKQTLPRQWKYCNDITEQLDWRIPQPCHWPKLWMAIHLGLAMPKKLVFLKKNVIYQYKITIILLRSKKKSVMHTLNWVGPEGGGLVFGLPQKFP